jgi:DNA-binding Lrp family transcriptional regulator
LNGNDVRILRAIGFAPFLERAPSITAVSPPRLARRLGLSAQTVKTRLRGLERAGVIAGYQLYPNFRLLGLEVGSFHFRAGDAATKRKAASTLRTLPGVWGLYDFHGADVCLDMVAPDLASLRERAAHASEVLGGGAEVFYDYRLPPAKIDLTPLDWRILAALRGNARRPLPDLARAVGVSARTVRRRLDRLDRAGAIDAVAILDPTRLEGTLPFLLMLRVSAKDLPSVRRKVLALHRDRWFAQWTPPDTGDAQLVVQLLGRSARDVEDLRREAETLPGVQSADALLPAGVTINEDWLDQALTERAAAPKPTLAPLLRAR